MTFHRCYKRVIVLIENDKPLRSITALSSVVDTACNSDRCHRIGICMIKQEKRIISSQFED
jgi:hypothetical protein